MKSLDLRFPTGGLDKRFSYQSQPPFTTVDCLNVSPDSVGRDVNSVREGRNRGGSRPGTGKAYVTQLGSGNPVRLLSTLMVARSLELNSIQDEFNNDGPALLPTWSTASWKSNPPKIYPDDVLADLVYNDDVGAVYEAVEFDSDRPYTLTLGIEPNQEKHHGEYSIFFRMASSSPDATQNGCVAKLVLEGTGGTYSGDLTVYVAGVSTTYNFTSGTLSAPNDKAVEGDFEVLVDGDRIRCYWFDVLILDQVIVTQTGTRFGFGMKVTQVGGVCLADYFSLSYYPTGDQITETKLLVLASAGGLLYREKPSLTQMEQVSSTTRLSDDRQLLAADRLGRLYIADYGPPLAEGADADLEASGLHLVDAAIADWTALGIDPARDVVVITNAAGGAANGTFKIGSVDGDKLVLATASGTGGTCSYRVERAPKLYNPVANSLTIWSATASKGEVPSGCPLIAVYRDRLVVGGSAAAPQAWYMSRQGDPNDWDYGQEDSQAAVAGTASNAGQIGERLTAIVAHSDDYLVFAGASSLWVLRGDPRADGILENVSRTVGIVGKKAWCYGPSGELIFLSYDGLYMLPPGPGGVPISLSREKLPKELVVPDTERDAYEITLEYDVNLRMVHVYLTRIDGTVQQGRHYWFDWEQKGFWPMQMPYGLEPTALTAVNARFGSTSAVMIGSRDGYVRAYRDQFNDDDGTTISSYVFYGPFHLDVGDRTFLMQSVEAVLGDDSNAVTWELRRGNSPEEAFNSSAFATGTWTEGSNYRANPRMRGSAAYLKLSRNSSGAWAVESVTTTVVETGRKRLL